MFILGAVLAAAALFLLAGLWLAFRLPGWEAALGISRLSSSRRRLVQSDSLRRSLVAVFSAFSVVFFCFLFLLTWRLLSQKTVLSFCFLALALFFDAVVILYRRFDAGEYPALSRSAGFICALCVNILLVGICFVLLAL